MSKKKDEPFLKYFSLNKAASDVGDANGATDTTIAGAKLIGKTLFNTALFAGKVGIEIVKKMPEAAVSQSERALKENPNMDPEKRQKMQDFVNKHKK